MLFHTASWTNTDISILEDADRHSNVFLGFCGDIFIISNHEENASSEILAFLSFFDMPASAAVDVFLLPIDLMQNHLEYLRNGIYLNSLCGEI